jgi:uncharacterized protein
LKKLPTPEPLTKVEVNRLSHFLASAKGGRAMNLEEMHGFFAALIAGPEMVMAREYLPVIFGGTMAETCEFSGVDEVNSILRLLTRQWNGIASALFNQEPLTPFLLPDAEGVCRGNDWSHGFMRGVGMRSESWAELFLNDEQLIWMIPAFVLHHEHDEDPELRPGPIPAEKRAPLIGEMMAGTANVYGYFRRPQAPVSRPRARSKVPSRKGRGPR